MGKETFDEYMRSRGSDQVQISMARKAEHQFGNAGDPKRALCSVQISFAVQDSREEMVEFGLHADSLTKNSPL